MEKLEEDSSRLAGAADVHCGGHFGPPDEGVGCVGALQVADEVIRCGQGSEPMLDHLAGVNVLLGVTRHWNHQRGLAQRQRLAHGAEAPVDEQHVCLGQ